MKGLKRSSKRVACNGLVKRFSLDRLNDMTYMSTGEIFDRLLEGKGIISKADADALVYVHKIEKELKTIKLPKGTSGGFLHYINIWKNRNFRKLKKLEQQLETGFKPIYFADLINLFGYPWVTDHQDVLRIFKDRIAYLSMNHDMDISMVELKLQYGKYSAMDTTEKRREKGLYVNPRDRYERFLHAIGANKNGRKATREEMYSNVLDELYSLMKWRDIMLTVPLYNRVDKLTENPLTEEDKENEKLYEEGQCILKCDSRYSFTTRHPKEATADAFRKAIEFICYIPSRAHGITLICLFSTWLRLKGDIARWVKEIGKSISEGESFTFKELRKGFEKITQYFGIVEIERSKRTDIYNLLYGTIWMFGINNIGSVIEEEGEDALDSDGKPFLAKIEVYGMTCVGYATWIDDIKIRRSEIEMIKKEAKRVRSYRHSKDQEKKFIYDCYMRFGTAFLVAYFDHPYVNDIIQYKGLEELDWLFRNTIPKGKYRNWEFYNNRVIPYYDIYEIEEDERGSKHYIPISGGTTNKTFRNITFDKDF